MFAVPKSAPPFALQITLQTLTDNITEGRLQQATLDLLAGSDIQFRRDHRLDIALVKNHPIALVFLPAADIPTFVGEGRVDLGITGQDQILEHEATTPPEEEIWAEEVLDLAFGYCRLQVQVPEKGSYAQPRDLIGRHICTSFVGLTKRYFASLEAQEKGVTNGDISDNVTQLKTKIKHLSGSVEAACALGVADGIVDLVGPSASSTAIHNKLTRCRVRRYHESGRAEGDRYRSREQSRLDQVEAPLKLEAGGHGGFKDTRRDR